jgi:hypothetical protein
MSVGGFKMFVGERVIFEKEADVFAGFLGF